MSLSLSSRRQLVSWSKGNSVYIISDKSAFINTCFLELLCICICLCICIGHGRMLEVFISFLAIYHLQEGSDMIPCCRGVLDFWRGQVRREGIEGILMRILPIITAEVSLWTLYDNQLCVKLFTHLYFIVISTDNNFDSEIKENISRHS